MTIELLLHTVLVKPEKVEDTDEVVRRAKQAGIHVQLDKREQAAVEYGFVVSIGPTAFKDYGRGPDVLSVGNKVVFAKYAGKTIKIKGEDFLILNDQDVIGILKEEE